MASREEISAWQTSTGGGDKAAGKHFKIKKEDVRKILGKPPKKSRARGRGRAGTPDADTDGDAEADNPRDATRLGKLIERLQSIEDDLDRVRVSNTYTGLAALQSLASKLEAEIAVLNEARWAEEEANIDNEDELIAELVADISELPPEMIGAIVLRLTALYSGAVA